MWSFVPSPACRGDDGLLIDPEPVRIASIRDQDEYSGVRVKFHAQLYTAQLSLTLDVSTGDPIHPGAELVVLPGLLGRDVLIAGHPPATVVAEKAVTIVQRGTQSTRWRDYLDLRNLARSRVFIAGELLDAATAVARHRQVTLGPTAPLVTRYGAVAQAKWAAWRRAQGLAEDCLAQLDQQMAEVAKFIDPVFDQRLARDQRWDPDHYQWDRR